MRRCAVLLRLRCAVFGGAFDPPTTGHLACIQQVLSHEHVDQVVVVPCGTREDKPAMSPKLDRYVMTHLAVQEAFPEDFRVRVSDIELREAEGLATYDLLQQLEADHPDTDFNFVIGSDWLEDAHSIKHWQSKAGRTGEALLTRYDFLVVPRHGFMIDGALDRFGPRFSWVSHSPDRSIDISSTEIRQALVGGSYSDIASLVPNSVLSYMQRTSLYKPSQA
eukprot:TRINITY_DN19058_c0_g1_i1.p1 TRINITY_DN19058_c0_g1~~TRINITY_DN19058_c0_g1_i1.p1  ORF type:complete len:221 (+),score=51.59 TRINITY_DN19058_c0_g1_i1:207-869(+)